MSVLGLWHNKERHVITAGPILEETCFRKKPFVGLARCPNVTCRTGQDQLARHSPVPPDSRLDDKGQVLWQSPNAADAHGSQTMDLHSAMTVFVAREPSRASWLTPFYPDKAWSLLPVLKEAEPRECIFFSKVKWVVRTVASAQARASVTCTFMLIIPVLRGLLIKWFQCGRFLSIFLRVNIRHLWTMLTRESN